MIYSVRPSMGPGSARLPRPSRHDEKAPVRGDRTRALLVGAPPGTRTPNPRIKSPADAVLVGPPRRWQSHIPLPVHCLGAAVCHRVPVVHGARAPDEHPRSPFAVIVRTGAPDRPPTTPLLTPYTLDARP